MQIDNLDLKKLRYFLSVAQAGNIGRAATVLGIDQTTLSRSIGALEDSVGSKVFRRHPKGVVLTEFGGKLVEASTSILRHTEELTGMAPIAAPRDGLVVGIHAGLGPTLICAIYECVRQHWPADTVTFLEADSRELETAAINGQADVAILFEPPDLPDLISLPVLEEDLLLVCPPGWIHRIPARAISFRELGQWPLVLPARTQSVRRYLDKVEQTNGVRLSPIMEMTTPQMINKIVNGGRACTLALRHAVADDLKRGALLTHPLTRPLKMRLRLVAARKAESRRPALSTLLQDAVLEALQDVLPEQRVAPGRLAA